MLTSEKIIHRIDLSYGGSMRKDKKYLFAERLGAGFVIISSIILHFIYDWSGGETLAALFGAVNESVWEHMKIFTFPYVVWSFIELFTLRPVFKRFVAVKGLTLYFLLLSIPTFFYTYTALIGHSILVVDILSGFLLTIMTFYISYRLATGFPNIDRYYRLSLFLLILYYITYVFFTMSPPKIFLFRDPVTGGYGIPQK